MLAVILLMSLFVGLGLRNKTNVSYMSFDCCLSVKGFFVALVFLRHFKTYPTLIPEYESVFLVLDDHLGQLIVTMFLFYSGYGILESIKKKEYEYVKLFPRRRLLKVLFQFDVAVMLFLVLGLFCGESFSLQKILLSLVAWDDLNNSSWFIFAILCCYFFTYMCFRFFPRKYALLGIFLLTLVYIIFIGQFKPAHWWDTVLCFWGGMLFSQNKNSIEKLFNKKEFWISQIIVGSLFLLANHFMHSCPFLLYPCRSISFCILLLLFLYKRPMSSRILQWLGKMVFPIYILQRIPMILFKYLGLDIHYEIYLITCAITTIALAIVFDKSMKKFDFLWNK